MHIRLRGLVCALTCIVGEAASQTAPGALSFEVASVRPHQGSAIRTGPLSVSGNLIRLQGYTLFGLILDAFHVRDYQVAVKFKVKPDDLFNTLYDVSAKAPGEDGASLNDVRLMLQTLLADRFHLRVHREAKEMPVFALVAGKGGAKIRPSSTDGECSVKRGVAPDSRNDEEVFTGCTVERLADRLTNIIGDRPVLDESGLAGAYDFRLLIAPTYRMRNRADPADRSAELALRDLGLVLSPKRATQEIIAIDGFDLPMAN